MSKIILCNPDMLQCVKAMCKSKWMNRQVVTRVEAQRRLGRPKRIEGDTQTSERILDAAATLFMRYGFDAVSTEQVADAAGVTKATVYYYFATKAKLMTAAMTQVMENVRRRTNELLGQDKPFYQRLIDIATEHIERTPVDFAGILQRAEVVLSNAQKEEMQRAEQLLTETIADAFALAMNQNEIRQTNPRLCARTFSALLGVGRREWVTLVRTSGEQKDTLDARQLAASLVELLWLGVQGNS